MPSGWVYRWSRDGIALSHISHRTTLKISDSPGIPTPCLQHWKEGVYHHENIVFMSNHDDVVSQAINPILRLKSMLGTLRKPMITYTFLGLQAEERKIFVP